MKSFEQIKKEVCKASIVHPSYKHNAERWNKTKSKSDLVKAIVTNWRWYAEKEVINENYLLENFTIDELSEGGLYYRDADIKKLSDFWGEPIKMEGYHNFDSAKTLCPEGYRLPTDEEFCVLEANTQYSFRDGCGVFRFKDGRELVLPANGYKFPNDEIYHAGRSGYYWSCSLMDDEFGRAFGFYAEIEEESNIVLTSGVCSSMLFRRYKGLSVCCVKDSKVVQRA